MFLCTLNSLLESMYGTVPTPKGLLPIETLHLMVTSHSLFLPTMIVTEDETHSSLYSKGKNTKGCSKHWINVIFVYYHIIFYGLTISSSEALVTLLLTLVKKCSEVCKSNHFHVLLGSYGATLSSTGKSFECMCFVLLMVGIVCAK